MKHRKFRLLLAMASATGTLLAAAGALAAHRSVAGHCGESKFWHHGKCEDARGKHGEKTWTDETLAKHWKP